MRFNLFKFLISASLLVVGCVPADEEEAVVVITSDDVRPTTMNPDGTPNVVDQPTVMDGEGCVDLDGDGWSVDCVDFGGVTPDCNDGDANNWGACATCIDEDGDGYLGLCDAYVGILGPDCADGDPNNWGACSTCVDSDGDGFFTGCDAYTTVREDCADDAPGVNADAKEVIGNGVDDDCNETTPDDCTYSPVPAVDPEAGNLAGMTRLHNYFRWRVGVQPLSWNESLAQDAAVYARECFWGHDPTRDNPKFSYVGENLYATTVQPTLASVTESVQAWGDERYDFDFGFTTGQTTGGMVGHYTQMVWDDTSEVGCAVAWCGNGISNLPWSGGTMVVCRYGTGGNYTGEMPYDYQTGACLDLDNDDVWQGQDSDDTDRAKR